jgi:hypothetical protein
MNNEKMNQIIDEVYKKYTDKYIGYEDVPIKELFIHEIKTNPEFSEKWGLKIEERELSLEERYHLWFNNNYETGMERYFHSNNIPNFDNQYYTPTPTKLITITYNETIEIYE